MRQGPTGGTAAPCRSLSFSSDRIAPTHFLLRIAIHDLPAGKWKELGYEFHEVAALRLTRLVDLRRDQIQGLVGLDHDGASRSRRRAPLRPLDAMLLTTAAPAANLNVIERRRSRSGVQDKHPILEAKRRGYEQRVALVAQIV